MKIKVGDKIWLKTKEKAKYIISYKEKFCGKLVTIVYIDYQYFFTKEDNYFQCWGNNKIDWKKTIRYNKLKKLKQSK